MIGESRTGVNLFQSTPPHGGRQLPIRPGQKVCGFNPRPRMGGDIINFAPWHEIFLFQSTPPHGGRHGSGKGRGQPGGFNPRPRMGGDLI